MLKNLVIVESPAKAKTIEKFLGKDYKVMSSYGHIRDLKKKNFSIDVDDDFTPIYEIPDDKTRLVEELRAAASQAETVWLASDEDREGEAIAWHLYEVLGLKPENTRRIVFHEITKPAILNAIANPRDIDINRVDAQQARRVLDRIVGFELSPVLWKKIKPSLSAGRVQSVAVRLIVEREEEINNSKSEPYFRVTAVFDADGRAIKADLSRRFGDEESAREFVNACAGASFMVSDVQVKPVSKSPAPPFTTSTLQQEAARKLGFTVSQTMMVAQRLYESGHITYMRTDSLNLSSLAMNSIAQTIVEEMGAPYLKSRQYHTHSKGAQEAHEAIRPTYIDRQNIEGTAQEKRLYNLIWKRAVASQMADAQLEKTTVDIAVSGREEHFTAVGEVIKFDGFLKVYIESRDDDNSEESDGSMLPRISVGEQLEAREVIATERFTQRPPRYTEAALVKKLEELGIGRPSTYAPTISTIQQRDYVEKGDRPGVERDVTTITLRDGAIAEETHTEVVGSEKGKLIPTDIGTIVNRFLTEYFPQILDYNFTAKVEEKFDEIAEGNLKWTTEIGEFYQDFHPAVESVSNLRLEQKVGERKLGEDADGNPVSVKIGRFGPLVQIGSNESDEKPRFASLLKGQSLDTITLEEALKLFEFPRTLGDYEDKTVTVGIGRFGPYVRHDGKYVSIPKDLAPAEISLEEAIQLIDAKRTEEKNRVVKVFEGDDELRIMNGRYGMYIVYQSANYKIPKTVENPAELTREEAMSIVENQEAKPAKKTGRTTRKAAEPKEPAKKESAKKETAKKTTAKKTAAKKAATTKKTSTKK
jgi:DNA topoisomerase-1